MPSFPHRFDHLHFESLDSTHLWCKRQKEFIEDKLKTDALFIISTNEQTQGVGRLGRPWQSVAGNITFNLNLADPISKESTPHAQLVDLSCACAWAICQSIRNLSVPCYLKWPNDLLTQKGKLGGCMIERYSSPQGAWLSIGVGINIYQPLDLQSIDQECDFLNRYGICPNSKEWAEELALTITGELGKLSSSRFDFRYALDNPYTGRGCWVDIETSAGALEGQVLDFDDQGRLHLGTYEGTITVLTSGQCSRMRARMNRKE